MRQLHILDGIVNDDLEPTVNGLRIAERRIDLAESRFIYIDCSQTHSAIRFMVIQPAKVRFFFYIDGHCPIFNIWSSERLILVCLAEWR